MLRGYHDNGRFLSDLESFPLMCRWLASMSPIERIRDRLQKHPMLSFHEAADTITVEPQSDNGFSVSLAVLKTEFVVSFDGWHGHFKSEDEALNCFALGLSDQCRLKVHRRAGGEYRWTLEHLTNDGWKADSETGRLFFPFWGRREIIYRQNRLSLDPP